MTGSEAANVVVLGTAPDLDVARELASLLVARRLAACVSVVPGMESRYWWDGEVQVDAEVLLVCKTRREQLDGLAAVLVEHHPYDCPEVVALPVVGGYGPYLEWIGENVE